MVAERKVAVVGVGLIGRAWAISFARGGCGVALYDPVPGVVARALEAIRPALDDLAAAGLLGAATAAEVFDRIGPAPSLAAALAGAAYVQESAPEVLDVKVAVFAELDAAAGPEAILASSTSAFVPSLFTEGLAGRHRCLVAHPINPPYLVPAVELVPAPWTEPAVVERARALLEAIGQAPIALTRELDGFVVNRLQGALLHEAFRLLAGGYASAADVDRAVAHGLGLRWSFMGPFETIDLNAPGGIRDYVARYAPLYMRLAKTQKEPCDWLAALDQRIEADRAAALPRERLGERQAWRDRRLVGLAAHKHEADTKLGS
jgi:3-hydroxyacyl-CoA dehydrogenase